MKSSFEPANLVDLVKDGDIEWAVRTLALPANAFHGADGDDPRLAVMRAGTSIDVAACPGSGKTTLLVAKLAILARYWKHAGQGVCVLSHTNVARTEIERRLGSDPVCRSLLGYPHFVGTIHGFVNSFIALPWLRSQGTRVTVIDDAICCARRWAKLDHKYRYALEQKRKTQSVMRIANTDFDLGDISWKAGTPLGRQTATYRAMVVACREATEEGFFCHRDMFLWAAQALERNPNLALWIRRRFPLLFLDEVQDNDETQAELLHRIFMAGEGAIIRHRFGDMNQAIYANEADVAAAATDPFPQPDLLIEIPNSHRFGQRIADAADPVALSPPGLIGLKPAHAEHSPLALLLFDPANAAQVLPAYAQLLTERFTGDALRDGQFTAIGSVQRDNGGANVPNCVVHYWRDYDHAASASDSKPSRFLEFVIKGLAERGDRHDLQPVVERVGDGILRLATILNPAVRHTPRTSRHRQVLVLLGANEKARTAYQDLAWALSTGRGPPDAKEWNRWRPHITKIAVALLSGAPAGDAGNFLEWVDAAAPYPARTRRDNIFSYPPEAPRVHVKVGTIHSVKGETHRATLILDTHYRGSHLVRIKDWLTGVRTGLASDQPDLRKSLKQHYVAMTRPSDLLCVAMRSDDVTAEDIERFRARNWSIGDVAAGIIQWRE